MCFTHSALQENILLSGRKKKKAWKLQGWVLIQVLPFLAVSACLLENGVFPHPVRSEDKK